MAGCAGFVVSALIAACVLYMCLYVTVWLFLCRMRGLCGQILLFGLTVVGVDVGST